MEIVSVLPIEIGAILRNISTNKHTLPLLCEEMKKYNFTEHQKNALVLWTIKSWTATKTNSCHKFSSASVNAQTVIEIVEGIQLEKELCQLLLLLPERRKQKFLQELCECINRDKINHAVLKTNLLLEASKHYVQNFMKCIGTVDDVTIEVFCENLNNILNCTARSTSHSMGDTFLELLMLLDSLLVDIPSFKSTSDTLELNKYGCNDVDTPSLLNTSDRWQVRQLAEECKRGGIKIVSETDKQVNILQRLIGTEKWLNVLDNIVSTVNIVMIQCKYSFNREKAGEEILDLVVNIAMKSKYLYDSMRNNHGMHSYKYSLTAGFDEFFDSLCNVFSENELVVYICEQASVDDVKDLYRTSKYKNVFHSIWDLEKDRKKKFHIAISILDGTFNRHFEIFKWLLGYSQLSRDQSTYFVRSMSAYTINYGTPTIIMMYLEELYKHHKKLNIQSNVHIECIFDITLRCLPYLSGKSIDSLIPSCQQYYEDLVSIFWYERNTKESFHHGMNECFNKITDDNKKNDAVLHNMSVFCFMSPYLFLKEMLDRVFKGMLKYSTVKKVLSVLPSVLGITFIGENSNRESVLSLLRRIYLLNKDSKASHQNLICILQELCKCGKHSVQEKTAEAILEDFVLLNFDCTTEQFLEFSTVIELLSELQNDDIIISYVQLTLLLEILLPCLQTGDEVENVNACIQKLLVRLSRMYEGFNAVEKEACVCYMKELVQEQDWSIQFLFRDFLSSATENLRINLPAPFYEFLSKEEGILVPFEHEKYTEKVNSQWMALFEIYTISRDQGDSFIRMLPDVLIDEEMEKIIGAIVNILTSAADINKFKTLSILHGLQQLVKYGKLKGVEAYLPENLQNDKVVHPKCFALLILMQCLTCFLDMVSSDDLSSTDYRNLQTFPKILNVFIGFSKELKETPKVQLGFCLYTFELVLYAVTMFDDAIIESFSLFMMDILVLILNCFSNLPGDKEKDASLTKCKELLDSCESQQLSGLKTKFDAFVKAIDEAPIE